MELNQVLKNRRSIRSFETEAVKNEDIIEIINSASYAPSINNSQPWQFVLIKNKTKLEEMAVEVKKELDSIERKIGEDAEKIMKKVEWYSTFFKDAPAVIAVIQTNYNTEIEKAVNLTKDEINKLRNYPDIQSIGAAIQNILLAAYEKGYGTCWLSAPSIANSKLEKIINVNADKKILAFIAIGKSKTNPNMPERKSINEIFSIIE